MQSRTAVSLLTMEADLFLRDSFSFLFLYHSFVVVARFPPKKRSSKKGCEEMRLFPHLHSHFPYYAHGIANAGWQRDEPWATGHVQSQRLPAILSPGSVGTREWFTQHPAPHIISSMRLPRRAETQQKEPGMRLTISLFAKYESEERGRNNQSVLPASRC